MITSIQSMIGLSFNFYGPMVFSHGILYDESILHCKMPHGIGF